MDKLTKLWEDVIDEAKKEIKKGKIGEALKQVNEVFKEIENLEKQETTSQ